MSAAAPLGDSEGSRRSRIVAAAACALAALFAWRALGVVRAERAYEAGIALAIDRPETDLPGRLEAYDEAGGIEQGEATYALRAAQIRLARLVRAVPDQREALLEAARADLTRALKRAPLDPRIQVVAAQIAQVDGDVLVARERADAAAVLGPRHPGALAAAVRVHLWAFRRAKDPEALVRALEIARAAQAVSDDPAPGADRATTSAAAGVLVSHFQRGTLTAEDVLGAAGSRLDLREFAARFVVDPAGQRLLRESVAPGDDASGDNAPVKPGDPR